MKLSKNTSFFKYDESSFSLKAKDTFFNEFSNIYIGDNIIINHNAFIYFFIAIFFSDIIVCIFFCFNKICICIIY